MLSHNFDNEVTVTNINVHVSDILNDILINIFRKNINIHLV
jgi:hypothetical protein